MTKRENYVRHNIVIRVPFETWETFLKYYEQVFLSQPGESLSRLLIAITGVGEPMGDFERRIFGLIPAPRRDDENEEQNQGGAKILQFPTRQI